MPKSWFVEACDAVINELRHFSLTKKDALLIMCVRIVISFCSLCGLARQIETHEPKHRSLVHAPSLIKHNTHAYVK